MGGRHVEKMWVVAVRGGYEMYLTVRAVFLFLVIAMGGCLLLLWRRVGDGVG